MKLNHNQGDLHIGSISGGKDSTALYLLMVEQYGMDFLPIFADTDNEHPVTVNYVKNLHIMGNGPQVQIVKADFTDKLAKKGLEPSGNTFLDMMMWKGRAPSSKAQFCTEWVKLWPMLQFLEKHHGERNWIMYAGLRQGESPNRLKKYPTPFTWNSYYDCEYILPMLYENEEMMFKIMEEHGVPPNPLYALGNNRVGCYPCIHVNKNQLSKLPDWVWHKLAYWESKLKRTWFPPNTVPGVWIPTIDQVREWAKTSYGGNQYDMFKSKEPEDAPSCMSIWGICE